MGTEGRSYVLDMFRSTPVDANWAVGEGAKKLPHRMFTLRHELVESYFDAHFLQYIRKKVREQAAEVRDVRGAVVGVEWCRG